MKVIGGYIAVAILAASLMLYAQPSSADSSKKMNESMEAYQGGDYDKCIDRLNDLMANIGEMTKAERIKAYTYMGLCLASMGRTEDAKAEFRKALDMDSTLALDPSTTSPKILRLFEETRTELAEKPKKAHYWAVLRSLVVPGWGQVYNDQDTKGYVMMGCAAASLGFITYTHYDFDKKNDAYRDERGGFASINDKYKKYEEAGKLRNTSYYVAGAVWTVGIADALIYGLKRDARQASAGYFFTMSEGTPMAVVKYSFK
jgi:tetratricopeptide (TPR) repeat protein